MTQNDTDWYNVSQTFSKSWVNANPPSESALWPSPAGHVFHSKPGFFQWIPCGALLMLLDRWMESSFTTFPDAHRDHVDHVMLFFCVPWLPWPKTECKQSTEKNWKDGQRCDAQGRLAVKPVWSALEQCQETTTNNNKSTAAETLSARGYAPQIASAWRPRGVRFPLYRDFSMPRQCCFHTALWRSYDERYHSRLSSRFQQGWFWSKQRVMYMYNNMFQWIISVVEVIFDLHTRRHHPKTSPPPKPFCAPWTQLSICQTTKLSSFER